VKDYDFAAVLGGENSASYTRHKHSGVIRNSHWVPPISLEDVRLANAKLDPYSVGAYLGAGRRPRFRQLHQNNPQCWPPGATSLDTKVWGEIALKTFDTMREIEQEPCLTVSHLAMEFNARGPRSTASLRAQPPPKRSASLRDPPPRRCRGHDFRRRALHDQSLRRHGFNRLTALSTFNANPRQRAAHSMRRAAALCWAKARASSFWNARPRQARGATILAEIVGYGSSCDAFAVTDNTRRPRRIVAIREALRDAEMSPSEIQYINAHALHQGKRFH